MQLKKYHQIDDEPVIEGPDARLDKIKIVRDNRLKRLEREKKQAQKELDQAYDELPAKRQAATIDAWRLFSMELILENYYLGQDVYMQNLRRWMEQTQNLKPQIEQFSTKHQANIDTCHAAQKNLLEKTKEVKTLVLQLEKLNLLQENWNA